MAKSDTHSASDVLNFWASAIGQPTSTFGYQSFENTEGTHSVAIVNNDTQSIVVQANDVDEAACFKKLWDAVQTGVVSHVDKAIAPVDNPVAGREVGPGWGGADTLAADGSTLSDTSETPVATVLTNDDIVAGFPTNDNGQVEIDENGAINGLDDADQPAGAAAAPTLDKNANDAK